MAHVIIYDLDRNKTAYLPLAYDVGYEKKMTSLWRAWFSVPIDDPHIAECRTAASGRYYAEIYDDDKRVELFKIVKSWKTDGKNGASLRFECYHVLCTLLDDEFDDTVYGSAGTATTLGEVIDEQLTANWQIGTCDFNDQYLYKWERGTTLLKALLDIPERMQKDYLWTFDTESYPWTLNLIAPLATVTAYIDYGRNLKDIEVKTDATGTNYVTRLYPHGAGAGADQIGIASVNPTGEDYIDAAGATEVVVHHWTDQNYTTAQQLYDAAVQYLSHISTPRNWYSIDAADIARLTGLTTDALVLGALVSVENSTLDVDVDQRIVAITKSDVRGKPGDIKLEIANKAELFDLRTYVQTNDLAGIDIENIPGGVMGALPATPTTAGVYISTDYLGYHNGTDWKTYFDNAGRIYAEHDDAYFRFNPVAGTLDIKCTAINLDATVNIIDTAQIVDAAVTDAKIGSMSVDKLTTGTLDAQTITLANAGAIMLGKTSYADNTAGFWLGEGGVNALFNIGDVDNYLKWNGENLLLSGLLGGTFDITADLDMNTYNITDAGDITSTGAIAGHSVSALTISAATTLNVAAIVGASDVSLTASGDILIDASPVNSKKIGFDVYGAADPMYIEIWAPTGGHEDGYIKFIMGAFTRYSRLQASA